MEKVKTLFLLRGLPGSGKTSAAKHLSDNKWPVLAADDFWYERMQDRRQTYQEVFDMNDLHLAHKQCFNRTVEYLKDDTEKVFCNKYFHY
jgi:dephospho-CoA kinase